MERRLHKCRLACRRARSTPICTLQKGVLRVKKPTFAVGKTPCYTPHLYRFIIPIQSIGLLYGRSMVTLRLV